MNPAFPDYERVTYSLWFRTATREWQAWSSECSHAARASIYQEAVLAQFPDAETRIVQTTVKREAIGVGAVAR